MSEAVSLDPIALEISWNGLKSIADECFLALMRSAFSTNIKERHDHSTAIADANGRLIVQAEMALPIHLASMSGLMACILAQYPLCLPLASVCQSGSQSEFCEFCPYRS